MLRHEGHNVWVRYDGSETRIFVARAGEDEGLTIGELDELVFVLKDALKRRRRFMRELETPRKYKR